MLKKPKKNESRTEKQIYEHYKIEKELSDQLRNASKKERRILYTFLYDKFLSLLPLHPQLIRKISPEKQYEHIKFQIQLLTRLVNKNTFFLEVGPGDCALSFEMAKLVKKVYAVDVSKTVTKNSNIPKNFELFISDGCSIPVKKNTIDVIYSNQLMEHLHPHDAYDQLKNIYRALKPNGIYLCITPSRLNGPHDISQYFTKEATGFHLKEYTITELTSLYKKVGFSKIKMYVGTKGKYVKIPIFYSICLEALLEQLPNRLRKVLAHSPVRAFLNIRLIGVKS